MERAQLAALLQASVARLQQCREHGPVSDLSTAAAPAPPLPQPWPEDPSAPVIIAERSAQRTMVALAHAAARRGPVFLLDPEWGEAKQAEARRQLTLPASWGGPDRPDTQSAAQPTLSRPGEHGWLLIPSGGSSGGLKFVRHDQDTLAAAVEDFAQHFGVTRVQAVGVLPLHHVSGLMAWMRTALTGGIYLPWSWSDLADGHRPSLPATLTARSPGNLPAPPSASPPAVAPTQGQGTVTLAGTMQGAAGRATAPRDDHWMLSLVPTQLQRLLGNPAAVAWLRQFRALFLGGGPGWPELLAQAAGAELPLSLCYGMTETAAMVAVQRPGEFRAGARGCGPALPRAQLHLDPEGRLVVAGPMLFRGYWPHWREPGPWTTEDLGSWSSVEGWQIHGRRDALIITGGKKVDPQEVETALRASGRFSDVVVLGVPDPQWGEAVVACHPAAEGAWTPEMMSTALATALAPSQRPKRYVGLNPWPRNEQGKINRAELRQRLRDEQL